MRDHDDDGDDVFTLAYSPEIYEARGHSSNFTALPSHVLVLTTTTAISSLLLLLFLLSNDVNMDSTQQHSRTLELLIIIFSIDFCKTPKLTWYHLFVLK